MRAGEVTAPMRGNFSFFQAGGGRSPADPRLALGVPCFRLAGGVVSSLESMADGLARLERALDALWGAFAGGSARAAPGARAAPAGAAPASRPAPVEAAGEAPHGG